MWGLFPKRQVGRSQQIYVAKREAGNTSVSSRDSSLVLASAATGKLLFSLVNVGDRIAFSPDGRTLIVATDAMTSTNLPRIYYYETATGQEVLTLPFPDEMLTSCWGTGGQWLATMSVDDLGIWDLRLPNVLFVKKSKLGSKVMDQLWIDLAGDDAAIAYQAIWKLSAAPRHWCPADGTRGSRIKSLAAQDTLRVRSGYSVSAVGLPAEGGG
jgi:WD40 repeat protein